ncbi:transposase [uncultured Jatrophihabitans sp.]|uniref:transposase n=1 Tax=uncultured Jatrophihabitans sp. TaxID=1610747 RepID=UPI0035CC8178
MTVVEPAAPGVEAAAYRRFERLRWPAGVTCPTCGAGRVAVLTPADGLARATRAGGRTERRVWRCAACRRQFSVLAGTVLAGTRVSLAVWAAALEQAASSGALPSPGELAARHRLTRETARRLLRVLDAAALEPFASPTGAQPLLQRLLTLPPAEVERVRDLAAARRRRLGQAGPTARYA